MFGDVKRRCEGEGFVCVIAPWNWVVSVVILVLGV